MNCERKQFECGVTCVFSNTAENLDIGKSLAKELDAGDYQFALIYFSKLAFQPDGIVEMMHKFAPKLKYAACTTAGEITPVGLVQGQMVVILFPRDNFQISSCQLAKPGEPNMVEVNAQIAAMKEDFSDAKPGSIFAMCLLDGMSYMEESITAALHWGLGDIPLLGGSAGDDMNFSQTSLILDGEIIKSRAIVMMISSYLPFQIFKTENFVPRPEKLVVTQSNPDQRIVHELNGAPAAEVYAEVIGADPQSLTPQSFASHPLVVRVGGEYYCRSIQKVNDDNSLTFFCAIDDGIVLTVAEPTGMARTTSQMMDSIKENLGSIDFILGFDCVLRQLDARNRQITHKISELYQKNNVLGFNTYGEQYGSMHLNQTFTGVAFGLADTSSSRPQTR